MAKKRKKAKISKTAEIQKDREISQDEQKSDEILKAIDELWLDVRLRNYFDTRKRG